MLLKYSKIQFNYTVRVKMSFYQGKSICENGCEKIVKKIFEDAKKYNCNILYPSDLIVSKKLNTKGINKGIKKIQNDDIILDIGPETILSIKKIVSNSNTILIFKMVNGWTVMRFTIKKIQVLRLYLNNYLL